MPNPAPIPSNVGHDVPALGRLGAAVGFAAAIVVGVAVAQMQLVSELHAVFLHTPLAVQLIPVGH